MKKMMIVLLSLCMLLSVCASAEIDGGPMLLPLPDTTMENLNDAIVAVSLEKGGAYLDDNGAMHMLLGIYSYDKYDPVDIAALKSGDVMLLCGEHYVVETVERDEYGAVLINGGMDVDGITLWCDEESNVYYVVDFNDAKLWYLAGYADFPVDPEFVYTDSSDLDREEPLVLYAGDFLIDNPEIDYFFYPGNTTVRIEEGMIVEMNRVYTP